MRIVTKITAGLLVLTAVGCREMPTVTVGGGRTLAKAGGATRTDKATVIAQYPKRNNR